MKSHSSVSIVLAAAALFAHSNSLLAGSGLPARAACERSEPWCAPPPEFRGQIGSYDSPLEFGDKRGVRNMSDWQHHRKLILDYWHGVMGAWPPLLAHPKIEEISQEDHPNF